MACMSNWKQKFANSTPKRGLLAPDWYHDMKAKGANREDLRAATRTFCEASMPNEPIEEELVDIMLITYES